MPKWTQQQQEAIESRGKSLIVCAAAGSGKTILALAAAIEQTMVSKTYRRIIATRSDMTTEPFGKRPDLVDVLFTAGVVRHGDGTATLYTGVSDCQAWCAEIEDPFAAYEN